MANEPLFTPGPLTDPPCQPFPPGIPVTDPCPTCGHPIDRHTIRGPYCIDCEWPSYGN